MNTSYRIAPCPACKFQPLNCYDVLVHWCLEVEAPHLTMLPSLPTGTTLNMSMIHPLMEIPEESVVDDDVDVDEGQPQKLMKAVPKSHPQLVGAASASAKALRRRRARAQRALDGEEQRWRQAW